MGEVEEDDKDLLEIKNLIKSSLKEDLNLSSPLDVLGFGMKMVA